MMREIILDTETTGLEPETGDRIVEIGAVELINHVPSGHTYHRYINPERDVPDEAFRIHGLSTKFLSDKPVFADICEELRQFIGDGILVIHNAAFDMKFLNFEFERLSRPPIGWDQVIDSLALARKKHPSGPNSLDALCRRYGIDNSRRDKHGALLDSELLAEVYIELIGGRQTALSLTTQPAETKVEIHTTEHEPVHYGLRPIHLEARLISEEVAAHDALVKTLGEKALWRRYLTANSNE